MSYNNIGFPFGINKVFWNLIWHTWKKVLWSDETDFELFDLQSKTTEEAEN